MCDQNFFFGGGGGEEGVVDGEEGSNERCLKWGVIKGSFQNIVKQGVGKGKSCS